MKIRVFMEPEGSLPCLRWLLDRIEPIVPNSYLTPSVSNIRFNIALTSTLMISKCYLPVRFPDDVLCNFLLAC